MDPRGLLKALADAEVRFVLIGGVAAVLQGVPVFTNDVDTVHARHADNRKRLAAALRSLGASYRRHAPRIEPKEDDRGFPGTHLLDTRLGNLDLIGVAVGGLDYERLLEHAREMDPGEGVHVLVADLALLTRMKEALGREKDRARLPDYRRALEEREKHRR